MDDLEGKIIRADTDEEICIRPSINLADLQNIKHTPLVVYNADLERILIVEESGDIVLRGKVIGNDKELVEVIRNTGRITHKTVEAAQRATAHIPTDDECTDAMNSR